MKTISKILALSAAMLLTVCVSSKTGAQTLVNESLSMAQHIGELGAAERQEEAAEQQFMPVPDLPPELPEPVRPWMQYLNVLFLGMFLFFALYVLIGHGKRKPRRAPDKYVKHNDIVVNLDNVGYINTYDNDNRYYVRFGMANDSSTCDFGYKSAEERNQAYEMIMNLLRYNNPIADI